MIFRQLFDSASSTYSYLLGCDETGDAVVIDPVYEQHNRDTALIRELDLRVRYVLDTHVHADHVTGAWMQAIGSFAMDLMDMGGILVNTPGLDELGSLMFQGTFMGAPGLRTAAAPRRSSL